MPETIFIQVPNSYYDLEEVPKDASFQADLETAVVRCLAGLGCPRIDVRVVVDHNPGGLR